jgi:hypothetical protein
MEVLNMSLQRTGSASVREALNILGIRCFHGFDLWHTSPELYGLWLDVVRAKFRSDSHPPEYTGKGVHCQRESWDRLLGDFGGASDAPCIAFADELRLVYPEAKVILVERDPDTWLESFMEVIGNELGGPTLTLMAWLDPWQLGPLLKVVRISMQGLFGGLSKEHFWANAVRVYREHYAHVKEITPPEQLLEYRLGSGWEPLCEFLGKPVPNQPFPRLNERGAIRKGTMWYLRRHLMKLAGACCVGVGVPMLVSWWVRGRYSVSSY